jgi:hypothetical protein
LSNSSVGQDWEETTGLQKGFGFWLGPPKKRKRMKLDLFDTSNKMVHMLSYLF